jgi:hypothetical protein
MPQLLSQVVLAIALLAVCSFASGFLIVRRLRWTPLEKLCGSVGLSLILVYLGAWAIFCFGSGDPRPSYRILLALVVAAAALSARDAWRLFRTFRVSQAVGGFAFLLLFGLAMLSMIRVYSGAGWFGDWFEHFQRSLFFLDRFPASTVIYGNYAVPARPPLMNVLAAFFLGLTAERFEIFQVVFTFLNLLVFLPAFLLLPALGVRRRPGPVVLTALIAASPAILQNATYTWTKALPAFFVLLAVALYLAGWRKQDSTRTVAAFLGLAAGSLAHYSAGPYLVFLALHYAWRIVRQPFRAWREAVLIGAVCGLLLATWFGWSLPTYGTKTTLGSNTSVTAARGYGGSAALRIAGNLFDTIVPGWLRGQWPDWHQPNSDGLTRDRAFTFYQLNLIFAMGSVGGPLVLWLLYRAIRTQRRRPIPERSFWLVMIPFCVLAGIAVVGERDTNGVPHLTLLALEILGLTAVAGRFRRLSGGARLLLVLGCAFDFYYGVFLHARVEGLENTPDHVVFTDPVYNGLENFSVPSTYYSIGENSRSAWVLKHRVALSRRWLEQLPRGHEQDAYFQIGWPPLEKQFRLEIADDAKNWQGWLARHGGSVTFLGDDVAGLSGRGTDWAAAAFVLLFAVSMWRMLREAAVSQPAKSAAPRKAAVTKVKLSGR